MSTLFTSTELGGGLGGAIFSDDRRFRYAWWRRWDAGSTYCAFIMLNPSKADETETDNTVNRCLDYARTWGYGGLLVGNISPLVSTDRFAMYAHKERFGEPGDGRDAGATKNDRYLTMIGGLARRVVFAWGEAGDHGSVRYLRDRAQLIVTDTLKMRHVDGRGDSAHIVALKRTKHGHPQHPLYVPKSIVPVAW